MAKQTLLAPVVRVAPLGELKVYPITEAELDELERGSPTGIHLNLAVTFGGAFLSLLASILTATFTSTRAFIVFVILLCSSGIAAGVFTVFWAVLHGSSKSLARRIRERMPPPPGVQEPLLVNPPPRPVPAGEG